MQNVFQLTLGQVGMILVFISIGFFLRRYHGMPGTTGQALSLLCTLVFSPAYSIVNLSKSITMDVIAEKIPLFFYGLIFIVVSIGLAYLLSKPYARSQIERNSLIYAFAIPNYGYFGYPVIEAVFGSAVLADVMVFLIPMSLATSSFGYSLFVGGKKVPLKKVLLTPMCISLVIGVAIGLTGIQLPRFINDALVGAGSCMSPCSMLLAGFMLGKLSLKELLNGWRPYAYSLVRLVLIPLIFGGLLMLLGVEGQYLMLPLLIAGIPLGLNMVVYPQSQGYEDQAAENAKICFVSYLLALAILPCTFTIIANLCA